MVLWCIFGFPFPMSLCCAQNVPCAWAVWGVPTPGPLHQVINRAHMARCVSGGHRRATWNVRVLMFLFLGLHHFGA